jgi:hypothetical protein
MPEPGGWNAATDSPRAWCWWAPLLALLLGAPAAAQKADRPDVRAGDQWRFAVVYGDHVSAEPNRVWVVTSVGAGAIEATENGEPLLLTPELNVRESPRERSSNPRALQFPLEVGKRWRFETDWVFKPKASHGSVLIDVEVVAHEKLTVAAGEFDAFRLVAKGVLRGTSPIGSRYDAVTTTTYWYAPQARAVVKSVHHNPYLGRSTVQLVDFRPGAR